MLTPTMFSLMMQIEGIAHVIKQLTTIQLTPSLEGPQYVVLKKTKEYEIRQYSPYLVAETNMSSDARPAGGDGFNDLAGYIFGGNSRYLLEDLSCDAILVFCEYRDQAASIAMQQICVRHVQHLTEARICIVALTPCQHSDTSRV